MLSVSDHAFLTKKIIRFNYVCKSIVMHIFIIIIVI